MRRRRGQARERGATLVEVAIVTPVFFFLITGIFEFGLLYRDSLTTTNAAYQGVRAASVSGERAEADYLILRSVEHGISTMGVDSLDFVVVFRASGPDDTVPPACLAGSVTAGPPPAVACNRYEATDFALDIDDLSGNDLGTFRCGVSAVDRFWCPTDRKTSLQTGVDYVGIYVQTTHQYLSGLFGGSKVLTETKILRLEPQST